MNECDGTGAANESKCVDCKKCSDDEYLDGCSGVNAGSCKPLTECIEGVTRRTTMETATSDRKCTTCKTCSVEQFRNYTCKPDEGRDSECVDAKQCLETEYVFIELSETKDRECAELRKCDLNKTYRVAEATAYSSEQCEDLSVCATNEYETRAKTDTSNRACAPVTECNWDDEYELTPATSTSDRDCKPRSLTPPPPVAPSLRVASLSSAHGRFSARRAAQPRVRGSILRGVRGDIKVRSRLLELQRLLSVR